MSELVIVLCDACGSEGRILRSASGHPNDPDTIDCGECKTCEGTGFMIMEAEIAGEPDLCERKAALDALCAKRLP